MNNFEQADYIQKYNSENHDAKTELASIKFHSFRTIIPDLKIASKEIKSYNRASRRWWRRNLRKKRGSIFLLEGSAKNPRSLSIRILNKEIPNAIYRIDLGMIVNKFIGETEKNLNQLFEKAESKNWILFFDGADVLFRERTDITDTHDKFSNQATDLLLESIERFRGIIILTTNSKHRFDTAFARRIRHVIDFSSIKDYDYEEEE